MGVSTQRESGLNVSNQLQMTVYASLMAALTAVGAFIAIPVGPVPIVLQNMFIMLTGLFLGSRWGLASVGVYLLAGACGLPVFSGGGAGIAHFAGPTGGYLIGYLPSVFIIGFISENGRSMLFNLVAMVAGTAVVYLFGVTWLKIATGMTSGKAMAVGMFPFLIGDGIKIVAALFIAKALQSQVMERTGR